MRLLSATAYEGANVYAAESVILCRAGPAKAESAAFAADPIGCVERICRLVPELGVPLRDGDLRSLAVALPRLCVALQNLAGARVAHAELVEGAGGDEIAFVFAFRIREVGLEAADLALRLLQHGLGADANADGIGQDLAAFKTRAATWAIVDQDARLVDAAERRDVPWGFAWGTNACLRFGEGGLQRRSLSAATDRTGLVAVAIASNKRLTAKLLRDQGLPAPVHLEVGSAEAALQAARRLGFPIVVKPSEGSRGRGVTVGVRDPAEVAAAFARAAAVSPRVLIERPIPGFDHRILIIGGRIVAVIKRLPAHVVGDGTRTIAALVRLANDDPRREPGAGAILMSIQVDAECESLLRRRGYALASVPPAGELVPLRQGASWRQGGITIDVTESMHPDNREIALRAIALVGLDVGGVDLITPDIARSYKEVGGAINEVQRQPFLYVHMAAGSPASRDVMAAFVDHLVPAGDGRIPIAVISGAGAIEDAAELLSRMLAMSGRRVGLLTPTRWVSDGFEVMRGDMARPARVRAMLDDPTIDAAVLALPPRMLLERGFGHDRCTAAALLASPALPAEDARRTIALLERIARNAVVAATDDPARCAAVLARALGVDVDASGARARA